MNLSKDVKITRVMNAVAAGITVQTSSIIDMQNFEGVMFVAALGTLSATQVTSLHAQQGAAADMADAADLLGTKVGPMADTDDDKGLVLELYRPRERYVRVKLNRATGNAVIDGIWAIQYGARKKPTAHAASVAFAETHVSPAEGTA